MLLVVSDKSVLLRLTKCTPIFSCLTEEIAMLLAAVNKPVLTLCALVSAPHFHCSNKTTLTMSGPRSVTSICTVQ